MTGVSDPTELRIAYIPNMLEPWEMYVSEPVSRELAEREDTIVGEHRPLQLDGDGRLAVGFD